VNKRIRRLTLINSVIGISIAGISTRIFMISVPTLATALGTDILGISGPHQFIRWPDRVRRRLRSAGDIYGHHKMYEPGMAIMAVGSLLCGLSQDVFN
jgi:hypothetical protein